MTAAKWNTHNNTSAVHQRNKLKISLKLHRVRLRGRDEQGVKEGITKWLSILSSIFFFHM